MRFESHFTAAVFEAYCTGFGMSLVNPVRARFPDRWRSRTRWQNTLAAITLGWTVGRRADRAANIVWRWLTEPALRTCFPEEDWPRHSLAHVSDLRATSARRGSDADVTEMVNGLLRHSEEFRALWERHEATVHRFDRKRLLHPAVGVLHLTCEVLLSP